MQGLALMHLVTISVTVLLITFFIGLLLRGIWEGENGTMRIIEMGIVETLNNLSISFTGGALLAKAL